MRAHLLAAAATAALAAADTLLTARVATPSPPVAIPPMGTNTAPSGATLSFDSQSLLLNGSRWLSVGAEFHYARVPAAEWRDELLKVKAAGVSIINTYVFWLHHQEAAGDSWNWEGQRSLRNFTRTVGEVGLTMLLRAGPWSHGEARSGGFPDWLVAVPGIQLRSNTSLFMGYVAGLYSQIAAQVADMTWGKGGPIIGMQVDNEYSSSAEYLLALKQLAQSVGFDVPFFSKTGWPSEPWPTNTLLPMFGGYADNFWSRSIKPDPSSGSSYMFASTPGPIAKDGGGGYPELRVEMGGGMAASYHRRILMHPDDMAAEGIVMLGSGSAQLGWYMFHGGQNPEGALSTLQETPEFGWNGYNDMPIKSYDFNAPVGEFGQLHGHYHTLRRLHGALGDADGGWGSWLAGMPGTAPDVVPSSSQNYSVLRWSVRSDGYGGMLFVANHVRNYLDMANTSSLTPDFPGVRFAVTRADGVVASVPPASRPALDVPSGAYWMWPFCEPVLVQSNGQRTGVVLAYATGQPVAALEGWDGANSLLHVFAAPRGAAAAEFGFYTTAGLSVGSIPPGAVVHPADGDGIVVVSDIAPGTGAVVTLETPSGVFFSLLFLSDDQSTRLWKATVAGRPRLFLSPPSPPPPGGRPAFEDDADTGLLFDPATPNMLRLRLADGSSPALSILPAPDSLAIFGDGSMLPSQADGVFTSFSIPPVSGVFPPPPQVGVTFALARPAGPPRAVPINKAGVAAAPGPDGSDAAFAAGAALYRLVLDPAGGTPPDPTKFDLRLRLNYTGDVARLYLDGALIEDHFYNGAPMEVGLTRYEAAGVYAPGANLTLAVLPLNASYPIYVVPPAYDAAGVAVGLAAADVLQIWDVTLVATAGGA